MGINVERRLPTISEVLNPAEELRLEYRAKLKDFQEKKKLSKNLEELVSLGRNLWGELFSSSFPEDKYLVLTLVKIEYELLRRSFSNEEWEAAGETVKRNYSASQNYALDRFTDSLRGILANEMMEETRMEKTAEKQRQAGKKPATKRTALGSGSLHGTHFAKTLGKTLKLGVHQTWAHVFEKMPKATNEKIVEFMKGEFPGQSTYKYLNPARIKYNLGMFTDGKIPSPLSEKVKSNGEVKKDKTLSSPKDGKASMKVKVKVKTKATTGGGL